jgi:hypothetical protein
MGSPPKKGNKMDKQIKLSTGTLTVTDEYFSIIDGTITLKINYNNIISITESLCFVLNEKNLADSDRLVVLDFFLDSGQNIKLTIDNQNAVKDLLKSIYEYTKRKRKISECFFVPNSIK